MSREASDATKLRHAIRKIAELKRDYMAMTGSRDDYRIRATKAEQDAAEWKARFDALLRRDGGAK